MATIDQQIRQALEWVQSGTNRRELLRFVTENPQSVKVTPGGSTTTLLHQIVASGNVGLLNEVIRIRGVYFPLDFQNRAGKSFRQVLTDAAAQGQVSAAQRQAMETHLNFLAEWDANCENAKNYLETTNEQLWAWLRRNSRFCYFAPPSRRWSIAMQVVYSGNVEWLQTLLRICPAVPQTRGGPNVWDMRGNDGKALIDVANEIGEWAPDMLAFVTARTRGELPQDAEPAVGSGLPAVAPVAVPVAVPAGGVDLEYIQQQWAGIIPAKIRRPDGECSLLYVGPEPLFLVSRDCLHSYCREGIQSYINTKLANGPFPARCPGCAAEGHDRGIITRSVLKALSVEGIVPEVTAQRLLLQQVRNVGDEPSLDRQYSMSKPCPFCLTPTAHYKGHGCHHISPEGGCSSCHKHFCFACSGYQGDGSVWRGCPNGDSLVCTVDCDCPICPDCRPGAPCRSCDGPAGLCPQCK